jgi:hypothetical protein
MANQKEYKSLRSKSIFVSIIKTERKKIDNLPEKN